MDIDMRTVVFLSLVINIVCSLFIIKLWFQNRDRYNGLGFLVINFIFQSLALSLLVFRSQIPNFLSIVIANYLVYAGIFTGFIGLENFVEVRSKKKVMVFNYIFLFITFCVHAFFTFASPSLQIRSFNSAVIILVLCGQCAWLMIHRVKPFLRRFTSFIGIIFVAYCIISILRIFDFFYGVHVSENYFNAGIFNTFMFTSYQILYFILTYSVVLMVNQRLMSDILSQENKFSKAFHSSPYAVIITSFEDGLIFDVNKGFEEIIGMTKEEVIGKTTTELNFWEEENARLILVEKLFGEEKVPGMDLKFVKKNGKKFIGHVMADVVEINGDKCILASVEDVTEKRKIHQIMQQTAKLDSLGILAGGIAHDFNNLLGGIFGYIDIAKNRSEDSEVSGYLAKALNTIERAKRLTLQLLTFSKGGVPRKKIGKLFPFIKDSAEFALSGSNVTCSFEYPDDLWMCEYDREQMAQVIDNIVINAKQAMSEGGKISIKAANTDLQESDHPKLKKGHYIKIELSDSGKGIPEELIHLIFDPFFTTKTHGHGLGLATSYSIVNRHNGTIDVKSEEGNGSTFTIYLPADIRSKKETEEITASKYVGSGTVIIMDDEEIIREILSKMLEDIGFQVIATSDGREAADCFLKEKEEGRMVSCLIFDLTVPGGPGGKESIEEIRKISKTVPVFVASGYADDPVISEPAKYGFTASMPKPFTMSKLAEILKKNL